MKQFNRVLAILFTVALFLAGSNAESQGRVRRVVTTEGQDQFVPFFLSIRAGDSVEWVNEDFDDHSLVTLNNTVSGNRVDVIIPGTDTTGGTPGTFRLRFLRPGTYVYYCRLHSTLNSNGQPVAPGPFGGDQDVNGNFGTPMMGVIAVSASTSAARQPSGGFATRR